MAPIRRIIDDAPAFVPIPIDLQHQRIELIIRPLTEDANEQRDQGLQESAALYAEIYQAEKGLQALTDSAIANWPA